MRRENGYYWVKDKDYDPDDGYYDSPWLPAEWCNGDWFVHGNQYAHKDSDWEEIDETKIERDERQEFQDNPTGIR